MSEVRAPYESTAAVDATRAMIEAEGGALAATMRRAARLALPDGAGSDVWHWVTYLRVVRGLRGATTVARYAEVVGLFLAWVRGKGWDYETLVGPQFDAWQHHLALGRHHSTNWQAQQLRAVRSFYDWRQRTARGANCALSARGPRIQHRKRRKYSGADLRALFATVTGGTPLQLRDRAVMLFLLTTGARREECARLEVANLELRDRSGLVRFVGKGAKEREIAFEGPVLEALRDWLTLRAQIPRSANTTRVWVGLSRRWFGRPIGVHAIEHVVARAARKAQLREWGVHRWRVTFATQLYDDGTDIERVRVLLGHESIETTRLYIDVSERVRSIRLRTDRQHEALGTPGKGSPLWYRRKLQERGDAPP